MSFFFDNTPFPVRFHGMHPGYRGISQLHDDIDRIFGGFMGRPENEPVAPDKMADFLPDIDLTSDEKNYVMKVELPGVSPEDVDIKLDDGVLTIGTRRLHWKKRLMKRKGSVWGFPCSAKPFGTGRRKTTHLFLLKPILKFCSKR